MKIALAQYRIEWEDKEANWEKVNRFCEAAAQKKAGLLCLPEMSLTGFSMNTDVTKETACHCVGGGKQKYGDSVLKAYELACRYHIAVGIGWVKACEAFSENHYTLVDRGGVLLDYAKIHPFSYSGEDQYFAGGSSLKGCEIDGVKIGVVICYDLRFGATFQKLADVCDMVLVPANWPGSRSSHWETLLRARAVENQCYVAGINCIGSVGGIDYFGGSGICNPDGALSAPSAQIRVTPEDTLLVYDLGQNVPQQVSACRKAFPVRRDRRDVTAISIDVSLQSGNRQGH